MWLSGLTNLLEESGEEKGQVQPALWPGLWQGEAEDPARETGTFVPAAFPSLLNPFGGAGESSRQGFSV